MMLCNKKDDTEKRNEHLKHMVMVLAILVFLGAAPNLVFLIVGVDIETGCDLNDTDVCLSNIDNSLEGMLLGNANVGLLAYRFVIAIAAVIAIGYKGIAA